MASVDVPSVVFKAIRRKRESLLPDDWTAVKKLVKQNPNNVKTIMQCIFKAGTSPKCPKSAGIICLQLMNKMVERSHVARKFVFETQLNVIFKTFVMSIDFRFQTLPLVSNWIYRYQMQFPQLSLLEMFMRSKGIALARPEESLIKALQQEQVDGITHRRILGDYAKRVVHLKHAIKRAERCAREESSPTNSPSGNVASFSLLDDEVEELELTQEQKVAREFARRERVWSSKQKDLYLRCCALFFFFGRAPAITCCVYVHDDGAARDGIEFAFAFCLPKSMSASSILARRPLQDQVTSVAKAAQVTKLVIKIGKAGLFRFPIPI